MPRRYNAETLISREPPAPSPTTHPLLGKTARSLGVMACALAVPYLDTRLHAFRVAPWPGDTAPLFDGVSAQPTTPSSPPPPVLAGEHALPPSANIATINNALASESPADLPDIDPVARAQLHVMPVEDPGGHALDVFFGRLARTAAHEANAVTRVLYYGDSTIASDYISGTVRRRLQTRFGDAGHGFILIANPWEWYFHNDVSHASGGGWSASRLAGPVAPDGLYGLGGVSFSSYGGAVAWFAAASRGAFGRRVSRFDVYYLEQPGGGDAELVLRGRPTERFSTRGDAKLSRVRSVAVEDGEEKLTVRAAGGGPVRLFGVALERSRAGVVVDALGSHAAMAVYWQRQQRAHWKEQMALRDPALIVFQYGTNESDLWRLDRDEYEHALADLIDELHDVSGGASILVVSPLDRAEIRGGTTSTKRVIFDLVAIQRRVAMAHGASFWSTFDAMGGDGAMARWANAKPPLAGADLTHPTPLGAEVLGAMLSDALVAAFEKRWRDPNARKPAAL